jgi:hypothetical protein
MATKEVKRSGHITCGICGKQIVVGKWIKLPFCPDSKCANSEERYHD